MLPFGRSCDNTATQLPAAPHPYSEFSFCFLFLQVTYFLLTFYREWKCWMKVLVAQSCLTLCNPMDCRPPGSSVHGIFQARILDWAAISFSRGPSWPRNQTHVSCTAGRFFTTEPPGKTRWRVKTGNFQLNYSDANLPNTTVQLSQLPFKITFALTRYKSPFPPLKVG